MRKEGWDTIEEYEEEAAIDIRHEDMVRHRALGQEAVIEIWYEDMERRRALGRRLRYNMA